jgi:hypothetical protein
MSKHFAAIPLVATPFANQNRSDGQCLRLTMRPRRRVSLGTMTASFDGSTELARTIKYRRRWLTPPIVYRFLACSKDYGCAHH